MEYSLSFGLSCTEWWLGFCSNSPSSFFCSGQQPSENIRYTQCTPNTHYSRQSLWPSKECKVKRNSEHEPLGCWTVSMHWHHYPQPSDNLTGTMVLSSASCVQTLGTSHTTWHDTQRIQHDMSTNTLTTKNMRTHPHMFLHAFNHSIRFGSTSAFPVLIKVSSNRMQ